jgi:hypothetical protein
MEPVGFKMLIQHMSVGTHPVPKTPVILLPSCNQRLTVNINFSTYFFTLLLY